MTVFPVIDVIVPAADVSPVEGDGVSILTAILSPTFSPFTFDSVADVSVGAGLD